MIKVTTERIDYVGKQELQIIQSRDVFAFSLDALFLGHFTYVPIKKGAMLDLCSGNGVIPLVLSQRSQGHIVGVEIQERLYDMAKRSVALNGLDDRIEMIHDDINDLAEKWKGKHFDLITCNPPYFQTSSDMGKNKNPYLAVARHEIKTSLEDVVRVSSQLLRSGGKASFVHRPNRLTDLLTLMRAYRLEPKRLRFVYPRAGKDANMILVEGMKDGKPDLKLLPPLITYTENNEYTQEVKDIIYG